MPTDHRAILANIKRFDQLIAYLRDEMGWPIETDDFEDLTFDYTPEELGIDDKNAAKIEQIKRMRPLSAKQPWGIFFIKFEPKKLPIVALRRILSHVALKKRASANSAERTAWAANDLLFVSNYGEGDQRTITFAHFSYDETKSDLPVLKVLGWNNEDTALHLDDVERELTSKLAWPSDVDDIQTWRRQWQSAFTVRHGEVISTSKDLSIRLAELARIIRDRINKVLTIETERGRLRKLMKAFQDALVHDLSTDGFADMYAQTVAYGLLSARITNPRGRTADDMHMQMTNPFLKELMETFLHVGGRSGKAGGSRIDFDELGVNDVVELLDNANMEAVVRDFGDRNPQEDPVIHFYELFLTEYDAKKRMQRGVFYTPRPIVSYIVRSVDELLRSEFGLQDGLADTTTWGEMTERHKDLKIPKGTSPEQPFIQILDPATGTGTFLVETINVIHKTMIMKWKAQHHDDKKIEALWNEYVPKYLLPRLHGYEILMAPYAIAHLKIGLKLYETGYHFNSEERVRIYLTNTLEPASDTGQLTLPGIFGAIAHEANAVNAIKRLQRFTVLMGNPPYAGISANNSESAVKLVDAYKFVDGEPLGERKHWLQDDYKKFVRIAQIMIETSGTGIVGYITNHGYLDDPTARGMRRSLMLSFPLIHVLDAHGSLKKREVCPDGTTDQNLFDIEPGVSIALFRNPPAAASSGEVKHTHLWGLRDAKNHFLATHEFRTTQWTVLHPKPRFYLFTPSDVSLSAGYEEGLRLADIFVASSVGCVTARDSLTIHWNPTDVWQAVTDFVSLPTETARVKYQLGKDVRDWTVKGAQLDLQSSGPTKALIVPLLYRPFDERVTYYTGQSRGFIGQPQPKIMRQFLKGENLGLCVGRQGQAADTDEWSVVFCTKRFTEFNLFRRGGNNLNPLYIYPKDDNSKGHLVATSNRRPNFSIQFLKSLATALSVSQTGEYGLPKGFKPEDIFNYMYAVFYSPGYRSRYAEFLKIDFPRLPLTKNLELFRALARLGGELVALHLLEFSKLDKPITEFVGGHNPEVEKVSWSRNTVWLDKAQTFGFKGVPEAVWNFHIGGYQVCEKWLKDRKGRTLSKEDLAHYQKIIVALTETISLMQEIDKIIDKHGGWPKAFGNF